MAERVNSYVIKGNIIYSKSLRELSMTEGGYAVCVDGISKGVFQELPTQYQHLPLRDYGDCLVMPGLVDLHVHAPQYGMRGFGMDMELLEWLNTYTFPKESQYASTEFARKAYEMFVRELRQCGTRSACVFATIHRESTEILMELLNQEDIRAYVGKVNMDRNAPDYLCEETAQSVLATREWLEKTGKSYEKVKPILTPRFIPTCSEELMQELQNLQQEYKIPAQSHLSENRGEIAWVKELCPQDETYGHAYKRHGMFGAECKTVMAHCVSSEEPEIALLRDNKVFVAHCPESNMNLSSGIAPIRRFLREGILVGLGSDVAGGTDLSIFKAMSCAIQASKLYWRYVDESCEPLSVEEAFYLGTKGGGAFFGNVGSLEEGYVFDYILVEDEKLASPVKLTLGERLERVVYLGNKSILRDEGRE